jgi:hypothetical protein
MLDLSETRVKVLTTSMSVLDTTSYTSSSLQSYVDRLGGLVDFQPLVDSALEGEVAGITVNQQADSILIRVRLAATEGAGLDIGRFGKGDEWQNVARLTAVESELHLFILIALKGFLTQNRRKRVWCRGKVLDGTLKALRLPQMPAAAVPEVLDSVRRALPIELPHQEVGLDREEAPLHLTVVEDDLCATRFEIDQLVCDLFRLGTDEQTLLNSFRCIKI